MSFPLVVMNVFSVFAVAAIVACFGFALMPIWRAKMRTMARLPILLGVGVAAWELYQGESVFQAVVSLFVVLILASMFLAFVYGWTMKARFDESDRQEGVGRFGPVMVLWTCCLIYVAVVALVNSSTTGSSIPFRHALHAAETEG